MGENWYKDYCPECKSVNWLNESLNPDIDALECHVCRQVFLIDEDDFLDMYGYYYLPEDEDWEDIDDYGDDFPVCGTLDELINEYAYIIVGKRVPD